MEWDCVVELAMWLTLLKPTAQFVMCIEKASLKYGATSLLTAERSVTGCEQKEYNAYTMHSQFCVDECPTDHE